MRLPDNYFREASPSDIIAKVGVIQLSNISMLGPDELIRIGWLNNPIIDILYSMTSAGVWIARTDSSGQPKVVEANGAAISSRINSNKNFVATLTSASEADGTSVTSELGWIEIPPTVVTRAGGAVPNAPIFPATASKHVDAELYFISNKTGSFTIDLAEDHSGTPAAGTPDWHTSPPVFSLVAGQRYGPFRMSVGTDNKDIGIVGATSAFPADGDDLVFFGRYRAI